MVAKYCARHLLAGKLADCVDKYALRWAVGTRSAGSGIDGVVLMAGRLSAPPLAERTLLVEGREVKSIMAPMNRNSGNRKLTRLFGLLGIDSLR